MKVLIACEFSGIVRDAFIARGHDAMSCDLEPTERPGPHYQGDVFDCLYEPWDLIIAHPPCTYLSNSGVRWLKDNLNRQQKRNDAVRFVKSLYSVPCERIAIENPIGHLSTAWMKPTQIIQPFHHGHPEWKSTCLWLRNLTKLEQSNPVDPDQTRGGGKKPGRISSRLHRLPPGPDRWRERSRTYPGIAAAMADQWGMIVNG
jgi:hypothetical protein